jgi:hypothetical protein
VGSGSLAYGVDTANAVVSATSNSYGSRLGLKVHPQPGKLMMYLGCNVLRRSTDKAAIHVLISNDEIGPAMNH